MLLRDPKIIRQAVTKQCIIICVSLLISALLWPRNVYSQDSASSYEQSIKQISQEIKKLSGDLNTSKAQRKSEQDKLFIAEKALKQAKLDIEKKQGQIDALSFRLEDLSQQLDVQTADVEQTRVALATFISKRYKNGQADYLKSLLSQENPYAVGRLENYHRYYREAFNTKYRALLSKIQATLELRAHVQDETEQRKAEESALEKLKQEQQVQTEKREQSINRLDAKINETQKSLSNLQANRSRLEKLLEQLKAQAKKLKELEEKRARELEEKKDQNIEKIEKPVPRELVAGGFNKQKGRLSCPIKAAPERKFGTRLAESGMRSEGLFYSTQGSKPVHSIFRGRVLFADFLKGYGLLIIVDHGDDHISLYGHNDRLLKNVGDSVAINEQIAQTGVTGGLKSHGLYFEIRHNTNPVDPSKWCR